MRKQSPRSATKRKAQPERAKEKKKSTPRPRTETIKFLTQDELARLLRVVKSGGSKRDFAIFLLSYRHGLRPSEVGRLTVGDVHFKDQRIMIHRLKNSRSGMYPMQPDEVKAVKSYLRSRGTDSPSLFLSRNGLPISRQRLDALMRDYAKAAKLPSDKQHFHCLRHSIATHLLDAGADIRFVQDWLGHIRIQNTQEYAFLVSQTRDQKARDFFLKLQRF